MDETITVTIKQLCSYLLVMHRWSGRCTLYELNSANDDDNTYKKKIFDGLKGSIETQCPVTRVGDRQFSISGWDCDYLLIG